MGDEEFAAKSYFHQDSGIPFDEGDNSTQLKMELARQAIAKIILTGFNRLASKAGVDIPIASAFERRGRFWI